MKAEWNDAVKINMKLINFWMIQVIRIISVDLLIHYWIAPCGLRGCQNRPAPFRGRMSYKAT